MDDTALIAEIDAAFEQLGCRAALHVLDLQTGAAIALRAGEPMVAASVFKAIVALEAFAQFHSGLLEPGKAIEIDPHTATPGPTGLSLLTGPASMTLGDLVTAMMTVSDNAATDILIDHTGLDAINARAQAMGCRATAVVSDLRTMLDTVAAELGFASYSQLLEAQSGHFGDEPRARSTDASRIDACAALDPARATRTTARDITRFLAGVWAGERDARACDDLRALMALQVTRRLAPAVPDGGTLAAKSGGLFGRVRNEIAVITYPDGARYAAAILTHARTAFRATATIEAQMAASVAMAIRVLRGDARAA